MDKVKIEAVCRYLSSHFPAQYIEHRPEVDPEAQCFLVHLSSGVLLLKVLDELLRVIREGAVPQFLENLQVAQCVARLEGTERGLLVTFDGLSYFDRE